MHGLGRALFIRRITTIAATNRVGVVGERASNTIINNVKALMAERHSCGVGAH